MAEIRPFPRRPGPGRPRATWIAPAVVAVAAGLFIAYLVVRLWAHITITSAFFDSLGMGGAYDTLIRSSFLLAAAGLLGAIALSLPIGLVIGRRVGLLSVRRVGWIVGGVVFVIAALVLIPSLIGQRDAILAAGEAVPFGRTDPVFGRDVSFFVFTAPVVADLAGLLLGALVVALLGIAGVAVFAVTVEGPLGVSPRLLARAGTLGAIYGGLALIALAVLGWFRRYEAVHVGGELIAGAGRATRDVGIPTVTVVSVVIGLLGVGLICLSLPVLRRRIAGTRTTTIVRGAVAMLTLVVVALVVLASPWWLVLVVPLVPLVVAARPAGALTRAINQQAAAALRGNDAPFRLPGWSFGAAAAGLSIVLLMLAPIGTALYDAIGLRGSTLQVERENIEATLTATRTAAGIDGIETSRAAYRRGGVSRAAIEAAPASVGSLRFLDLEAALAACRRLQAIKRFYTCQDADLDRYQREGTPQTLFVFGREVDYPAITDFQRRHFSFTHGRRGDGAGQPDRRVRTARVRRGRPAHPWA